MIDIQLDRLIEKYENNYKPVQFDFRSKLYKEISDHFSDGKKHLHYIHSYPGRISPHIPYVILSLKELEELDGYVLDPFAGTGTILLESIINSHKKRHAFGIEINPLGRLISKVKTTYYDLEKLEGCLNKLKNTFKKLCREDYPCIEFPNVELWFSKKAINRLSKLHYAISQQRFSNDYKDFLWVCFSKIIRRVAKADPRIPPPVILKPDKYTGNLSVHEKLVDYLAVSEDPPVWKYFEQAFSENCKLATYLNKEELFNSGITANIIGDSALELKVNKLSGRGRLKKNKARRLSKNSIEIILTSPPYITAQKYIRSTKLELFWLGYSSDELLKFEKNTVGSEYVSMSKEICEIGSQSVDELICWTYKNSKERGIMVFEFFERMNVILKELYRVLKPGGYSIFIMGDNNIMDKKIKTYQLITNLAVSNGFKELITLKDLIRSRSMITKRNGTGGLIKNEFITILHKGS